MKALVLVVGMDVPTKSPMKPQNHRGERHFVHHLVESLYVVLMGDHLGLPMSTHSEDQGLIL